MKRYTVTSALPYANGPLHIGHVAGAYLPADIYVRSLRMRGKEVLFICGSDEHGAAITMRARKENTTPRAIVDKYHGIMKKAFTDLGISFDVYHRTSDPLHYGTAQAFFLELHENGAFTEQESEQYFDEEAQQFLADRYIIGTCPKCGHEEAYGDQCEKCGSALSPLELIDPRSTLTGSEPVLKMTKHWYLPMDHHQDWVDEWMNKGTLDGKQHHDPKQWKPQVLGQCNSWLKDGLRPRAMTRDLDWGVPVPLKGADGKVLYVWLDAPIGYISATKAWALERTDEGRSWEEWWKDEDAQLVHFIGKDNIVFHCIIFPILLKTHGGFNLPINVPANEFLNLEGKKISTSRNWAVWLHEYLERWPNREDELRYTLCSLLPEFRDSEFTWKEFQDRNNNELVAIVGNFVNRVMVLCQKYYDGKAPAAGPAVSQDAELFNELTALPIEITEAIDKYRFREAQAAAMNIARAGNKYLADTEPWKLQKSDPDSTRTVLYNGLHICAMLGIALEPFLPFTALKLRKMLGQGDVKWDDLKRKDLIKAGQELGEPEHLFSKIEDEQIAAEVALLHAMAPAPSLPRKETEKKKVDKPNITFDQFSALDMRVATIKEAEKVPKADRLLQLKLDVGSEERTVISGIAEHFAPEELPGKQVLYLANLEPRKMRGVLSEGMILMAEDADGKLRFMEPGETVAPGAAVA